MEAWLSDNVCSKIAWSANKVSTLGLTPYVEHLCYQSVSGDNEHQLMSNIHHKWISPPLSRKVWHYQRSLIFPWWGLGCQKTPTRKGFFGLVKTNPTHSRSKFPPHSKASLIKFWCITFCSTTFSWQWLVRQHANEFMPLHLSTYSIYKYTSCWLLSSKVARLTRLHNHRS